MKVTIKQTIQKDLSTVNNMIGGCIETKRTTNEYTIKADEVFIEDGLLKLSFDSEQSCLETRNQLDKKLVSYTEQCDNELYIKLEALDFVYFE